MAVLFLIVAAVGVALGFFLGVVALRPASRGRRQGKQQEGQILPMAAGDAAAGELTKQPSAEEIARQENSRHGDAMRQDAKVAVGDAGGELRARKELWVNSDYYWVVVCKNDKFHRHPNRFNMHRIPLGETDTVAARPPIARQFVVRCDECGMECLYEPSDVLRCEMEIPSSFVPHLLFQD